MQLLDRLTALLATITHVIASRVGAEKPMSPTPLSDSRTGDFFSWFCLKRSRGVVILPGGAAWNFFSPENREIGEYVEIGVLTSERGQILETYLSVDRAFIEGRSGQFARDLIKSYLSWAIEPPRTTGADRLIDLLEDVRLAPGPVIVGPGQPARPALTDTTGCLDVYFGRRHNAKFSSGSHTIWFLDFPMPEPEIPFPDVAVPLAPFRLDHLSQDILAVMRDRMNCAEAWLLIDIRSL